jgi:hypothetical protein
MYRIEGGCHVKMVDEEQVRRQRRGRKGRYDCTALIGQRQHPTCAAGANPASPLFATGLRADIIFATCR